MAEINIDDEDYVVEGITITRSEISTFVNNLWGGLAADPVFRRRRTERLEAAFAVLFPGFTVDEELE